MATGESGFGSPTLVPAAAYPDAGFGDPYDDSFNALARDTGFGSPYDPLLATFAVDTAEVSVQGGSKVVVYGPFTAGLVYPVKAVNGLTVYPCFGGVNKSLEGICFSEGRLTTYTPALPEGQYDLQVDLGGGVLTTLTDALTALPAVHSAETYIMRKFFSPSIAAGDRAPLTDRRVAGTLSGLLDALGSIFNNLSGKSHTYTTQDITYGDTTIHVMSTLSFPEAGQLTISGNTVSYTGKTSTTFTGVAPLAVNTHVISAGTEVSLNDKPS